MQMNNPSVTIERKKADCSALPKGWQREEVLRKSGIAAGKVDVYYYSPTGKRIETKPQLSRHLGDSFDISCFDFQSGKLIQQLAQPLNQSICLYRGSSTTITPTTLSGANILKQRYKVPGAPGSATSNSSIINSNPNINPSGSSNNPSSSVNNYRQQFEISRALRPDVSLVPPIRQTASIFKQPVTVIRNHENSKVKHDTKNGAQEKPKQLFWEKRLERLRSCHSTGEELNDITLPKIIKTVGPNVTEQTVLQSLATALHVLNGPVTGQKSSKTDLTKNVMAFMNPDQPLIHDVIISDEDIRKQEDRVTNARRKLTEALKA